MSDEWLRQLIQKHRASGLVVDTNLLLVYFIGLQDKALVPKFKRTQAFIPDDFEILRAFLAQFARIVTVPGILTEVNSLANSLQEQNKPSFFLVFKEQITLLEEEYTPSKQVAGHVYFAKCGLTDAAILTIATRGLMVLTDDFRLTEYLRHLNIDHLNFNHIRFVSQ